MVSKTCQKCKLSKSYEEFLRKDTLGKYCNSCLAEPKQYKQCKEYARQYRFNRIKRDPLFNMTDRIRSLIYGCVVRDGGYSKKSKTHEILGCSFEFFKDYIEGQFIEGMEWSNIHLDHIKPVSLATSEEELLELNHYTNFQPLFALDNLRKGNKYE